MRSWMVPLLFPMALVGTVALLSVSNAFGWVLATVWGWLVLPCVAVYTRSHSGNRRSGGNRHGPEDVDTSYWRTKLI